MRTNNYGIEEKQRVARKELSDIIVGYIERNGLSVCRFSQMAKISQSQMQLIIDGKTNPSMDILIKITTITGEKIGL